MWEIYQMIQKVILVGLLTFINRGSILQVLVGVLVSNTILISMIRTSPYLDVHTNVLAMMGQTIVVLSYLSALLMRVDLATEAFTVDTVGTILIACNIPMMLYLAWDTWTKMQIKFFEVQIDLLAAEMGGVGATYRALHDVDVLERRDATQVIQYINWLGRKKIQAPPRKKVGTLLAGTVVTSLDQAITHKGVGRILVDGNMIDGNTAKEHVWVRYNVTDGSGASILTGERHLQLLHHVKASKTGRLEVVVRRLASPDTEENTEALRIKAKKPGLLLVTVLCCRDLKNMDTVFGKNDVYVSVTVNGRDTQRTVTIEDAGSRCKWGKLGVIGETLVFEDVSMLKEMVFHVFDEDDNVDADGNTGKTSELIGLCRLPLEVVNMDLYAELDEGVLDKLDDEVRDALGDAAAEEQRTTDASVRDLVAEAEKAAGPEAERASDKHAEKKRQKEERLWSKIARDEHGMGTWHWHSTPLLTLREDVDVASWKEDVEQGEHDVTGGALGGFAAMVAKRASTAVSSKIKAADQKDQQRKDKAHKKKHKRKHKKKHKENEASDVREKEATDGMGVPSAAPSLEEEEQVDYNPLFSGTQPPSEPQGSAQPGAQPVEVAEHDPAQPGGFDDV
jgi:cytochrome c5